VYLSLATLNSDRAEIWGAWAITVRPRRLRRTNSARPRESRKGGRILTRDAELARCVPCEFVVMLPCATLRCAHDASMSAPGWYPDPSGSHQQRYFDGAIWTNNYAPYAPQAAPTFGAVTPMPPRASSGRTVGIVVGIVGVVVVLGAIGTAINDGAAKTNTHASSSSSLVKPGDSTPSPNLVAPEPVRPSIAPAGSAVRDGKFEFTVLNIATSKTAGDLSNQFETETAQGQFITVKIAVRNIGNEPQTFFAGNQKLHAGGQEFSPNTMAAVWTRSASVEINPGNSVVMVVSFDVPASMTTVNTLEVHDSAFSGGTEVALG
jgi:hypothetical protein